MKVVREMFPDRTRCNFVPSF